MSSNSSVLSLPLTLILLVHLHLLEFHDVNNPEYHPSLFDPRTRGLRDRVKTMEDVSYFLVGRIEGRRDGARSVLPAYPCSQPSDTVAYRTSLTKYTENLKSLTLHSSKSSGGDKNDSHGGAWWWKDVIIRKSLLEECVGEKFERLLVSLSTHAMFSVSRKAIAGPINCRHSAASADLYAAILAQSQSALQAWTRSASLMVERRMNLKSLRGHIIRRRKGNHGSEYATLSTERLTLLAADLQNDLIKGRWSGAERERCLQFAIDTAGLRSSTSGPWENPNGVQLTHAAPVGPPQLLPVAAAHHPSHLRRLRRGVFDSRRVKAQANYGACEEAAAASQTTVTLSDRLETERLSLRKLSDALRKTKQANEALRRRLVAIDVPAKVVLGSVERSRLLTESPALSRSICLNFDPQPTDELLASLSPSISETRGVLDSRINHIREYLLPLYPSLPSSSQSCIPFFHPTNPISSSCITTSNGFKDSSSRPTAATHPPALPCDDSSLRIASLDLDEGKSFENEVSRLVQDTLDTSNEDPAAVLAALPPATKRKPKVNRIYTAGTPLKRRPVLQQSSPGIEDMGQRLPSLSSFKDLLLTDENKVDDAEMTPVAGRARAWNKIAVFRNRYIKEPVQEAVDQDPDDGGWTEGKSLTLGEILRDAEPTAFDLLDDIADPQEGFEETSFAWE